MRTNITDQLMETGSIKGELLLLKEKADKAARHGEWIRDGTKIRRATKDDNREGHVTVCRMNHSSNTIADEDCTQFIEAMNPNIASELMECLIASWGAHKFFGAVNKNPSNKQDRRAVLEAVEDRFEEIEFSALHGWNRLDTNDPEVAYYKGFHEAIKYLRREYRRTLSAALFGK